VHVYCFHIYRVVSYLIKTPGAQLTCGINVHKSFGVNLILHCSSAVCNCTLVVETSFKKPNKNVLLDLTLKMLFIRAVLHANHPTLSILCSPNFDLLRLNDY